MAVEQYRIRIENLELRVENSIICCLIEAIGTVEAIDIFIRRLIVYYALCKDNTFF